MAQLRWNAQLGPRRITVGLVAIGMIVLLAGANLPSGSRLAAAGLAAPTPTPPPPATNCAPNPHLCGFPDATNTGVPAGTVLRRIPQDVTSGPGWSCVQSGRNRCGWVTISGNGTVFDSYSMINGPGLVIEANNVTVKRSEIMLYGQDNDGIKVGQVGAPANHVTIEDCTLHGEASGNTPNHMFVGILATFTSNNVTTLRNNIYNVGVGIQYASSHGLAQDNYIHDFGSFAYPPSTDADHNVAIGYSSGSTRVPNIARHNTLFNNLGNYVLELNQDDGPMFNSILDDNLLAGGGYLIYGGDAGAHGTAPTHDLQIINNRYSKMFYQHGGFYGTVAGFNSKGVRNVYAGNVWDDTGGPA